MSKKSIVFIISILAIIMIFKGAESIEQQKKLNKIEADKKEVNENKGDKYEAFGTVLQMDGVPDVCVGLNETFQIRVNKDENKGSYEELEIILNSAQLSNEIKQEYIDDEELKAKIEQVCNKESQVFFEEELRFIYLDLSVKNISENDTKFQTAQLRLIEGTEFGKEHTTFWLPKNSGINYIRVFHNEELVEIKEDFYMGSYVELKAGEAYRFEGIAIMVPGSIEDLYLATNNKDNNTPNDQVAVKLDITLNETNECDPTDGVVSDYQKRDLKQLRINAKHTSYSFFEEQTEAYSLLEDAFHKFGETVGKPWEQSKGEVIPGMETTLLEAELIENREELPDRFKDSEYIDGMMDIYLSQLPYKEEEYRYIYLKADFKWLSNIGATTKLSDWLWLYNKDEDNNLWTFGLADDYYILSSTNDKQTIDYQNILPEQGEKLTVEAVYIVVPDTVYELYWYSEDGGLIARGGTGNTEFYGAISLDIKNKESGGIK